MKLGFQFVPFPREVWTENIDLTQAEFRLLGWLCCNLKLGITQSDVTDEQMLNGFTDDRGNRYPGCGLARNSIRNARTGLMEKKLMSAVKNSEGGGRGKAAVWHYSLSLSIDVNHPNFGGNNDVNPPNFDAKPSKPCMESTPNKICTIENSEVTTSAATKRGREMRSDPRRVPFMEQLQRAHQHFNKTDQFPFMAADGAAVDRLLRACPKLDVQMFRRWLGNYYRSEKINPANMPRFFLGELPRYARGPLTEFKRPMDDPNDDPVEDLTRRD